MTSGVAIGLAMVNLMSFNGGLCRLLNSWSNMETSLGAAARLRSFIRDTPNENRPRKAILPPDHWTEGSIKMNNVNATYK